VGAIDTSLLVLLYRGAAIVHPIYTKLTNSIDTGTNVRAV